MSTCRSECSSCGAVAALLRRRSARARHAGHRPFAVSELDALAEQHLGPKPPIVAEGEQAVVVECVIGIPISSMWPRARASARRSPGADACERGAERVARDLGEGRRPPRARPRGRLLVAGGPGGGRADAEKGRRIGTACGFKHAAPTVAADDSPSAAGGPGARAGRKPAPEPTVTTTRDPLDRRPARVFFVYRLNPAPSSTPIWSRRSGRTSTCASPARRASCSSRSSRAGSGATRSSAAASGSSLRRGEALGSRSSATSATTTSRSSSRPCRCPTTARACRRAGSSSPTSLVRFDHARGVAEVLAGDPEEIAAAARRDVPRSAARAGGPRAARPSASPTAPTYERGVERCKEHIRAATRSRSCSRSAPSGRRRLAARDLPRAAARQPVAVPLPARARRHRARRLVARDAREARGRARHAQPDRGLDAAAARATPSGCSPPRRTAPST